jgi:hypothetical protein
MGRCTRGSAGITRAILAASVLALAPLASHCRTGDGTLDPSNYQQTCATDADCVTVAVGVPEDACCSDCEASAISKGDLGKYQEDLASFCAKLTGNCPPGPTCPLAPAVCVDGTCTTDPSCTTMLVCPDAGSVELAE